VGDIQPGDILKGDIQAGDLGVGDIHAGDIRAGDIRAGDIRAGDVMPLRLNFSCTVSCKFPCIGATVLSSQWNSLSNYTYA
jgi:hypothetical protein